jgi:cephalosporin-C deacetylase-like acetyl esterase
MRTALFIQLALVGILAVSALPSSAQDAELIRHFDYDQKAPLGLKQIGVERRGDVAVHDITYDSPKGGVVPAYLVVPKGKGPFAAVIWGHWYWDNSPMRNRKQFLDEAVVLAQAGVVSLLTDGPVARPGHVVSKDPLDERVATDFLQQVIDMRRGVDVLLARKDVDAKRIAYVGHSYNAGMARS